jgi:hypothetical protein
MRSDWLPGKRADQLAMAQNWQHLFATTEIVHSYPSEHIQQLQELAPKAEAALAEAQSSGRNAVATAACRAAFEELAACMRLVKDRCLKQPPLTDANMIAFGLKPRDTVRTPVAAPTGQAEADVTYPGPHLLMLHIKPLSGTTVDPRADHGYRIYYGILPHGGATVEQATGHSRYLMQAPVSGDDLPHSQFTRRRREMMVLSAADSGKTAYFCIRFENSKGEAGPWGPVFSAVIP